MMLKKMVIAPLIGAPLNGAPLIATMLIATTLLSILAACTVSQQDAKYSDVDSDTPLITWAQLSTQPPLKDGTKATLLPGLHHGLVSSESAGLLLIDASGKELSRATGSYESFDLRESVLINGSERMLVLAVDQNTNQPNVFAVHDKRITRVATLPALPFQVDQMCLYQDASQLIHAFYTDGRSHSQQWLVWDGKRGIEHAKWLRRVQLPANIVACSVDDTHHSLYVAEEGVGVWRYGASPESPPARVLVDLPQPRGHIAGDVGGMAAIAGGVVVINDNGTELYRYLQHRDSEYSVHAVDKLSSNQRIAAQALAITASPDTPGAMVLAATDDDTGTYWHARVPLSVRQTSIPIIAEVGASVETKPMDRYGDTADDPAIWVNNNQPEASLVLATNKRLGLFVYDLDGNVVQQLDVGRLNNVDLRYAVAWRGKTVDVAAASLRNDNSLALFSIDRQTGWVEQAGFIKTDLQEIYGTCMYQSPDGDTYIFANDKDGRYQQYLLTQNAGQFSAQRVRRFSTSSQPEGCVADDQRQQLYLGEEDVGVWVVGANPGDSNKLQPVIEVGQHLHDDVEGLGLLVNDKQRYLIISSQGNDSYVVVEAEPPYRYRGRFRVGINTTANIDGSSETDGLDITSHYLGERYPQGMLVVQDGRNVMPQAPQNYKYVSWSQIRNLLDL